MSGGERNRGRRDAGHAATTARRGGGLWALFSVFLIHIVDRIDEGVVTGAIDVTLPDGEQRRLGNRRPGPIANVDIRSWNALLRLARSGSVGWYEGWANGEWSSPDPVAVFQVFSANRRTLGRTGRAKGWSRWIKRFGHWLQRNTRSGARRNIHYHYDLGNDFYAPWLDAGMTYSSARFADPIGPWQALGDAQTAKLERMLERTATRPGDSILEIGSGWGSFAEHAGRAGRRVHGITLSQEQKAFAEHRIAEAEIDGVTFEIADYRDVAGEYDAVVSIEMVEAVGQDYWDAYLAAIARALRPGGRAALQLITIDGAIFPAYAENVDFIQAYVFPGGLLIAERRFGQLAKRQGLAWTDREAMGASYAETLKRWRERFDAAAADGRLPAEFDAGFIDLWRYYLMYCEGGFRGGGVDVVQVTLVKEGTT